MQKQDLEKQPEWLELPDKESYWICEGEPLTAEEDPILSELWSYLFYTKEEAEANASIPNPYWKWDGLPAKKVSLQNELFLARKEGIRGVLVQSFRNGELVIVKEYPCEIPYSGE